MAARSRQRAAFDIWPGFVDALASLLIIIIFTLMIFVVAQFYLTDALSGRDKALARLTQQITELSELLALEKKDSAALKKSIAEISAELQATLGQRDKLKGDILASKEVIAAGLAALREQKEATAAEKEKAVEATKEAIEVQARLDLLNRQIAELRTQLASIQEALEASEAKNKDKELEVDKLTDRLNKALAAKAIELQKYRSEFFGKLREILADRDDIRIVGDRFVFQSEVLFDSGFAELRPGGMEQIAKLAETLKELGEKIPPEINWVLRVDGHTDVRPIQTEAFPSNWELSTARAVSVVKFLVAQGIPPERLAATGFGEFQPLVRGKSPEELRKNRRIELKFDQR